MSKFLYFAGLVGAVTTSFGVFQAIFTDKLIGVVPLEASLCELQNDTLETWEKKFISHAGEFILLDVNISENSGICDTSSLGEYPFMDEDEEQYNIPLSQPVANYMPRLQILVAEASAALLTDGFLDFFNEGELTGSGIFFVDLQDNPHTGPLYRMVPAPYSLQTSQMYKCTTSVHYASDFITRFWAFTKHCITSS